MARKKSNSDYGSASAAATKFRAPADGPLKPPSQEKWLELAAHDYQLMFFAIETLNLSDEDLEQRLRGGENSGETVEAAFQFAEALGDYEDRLAIAQKTARGALARMIVVLSRFEKYQDPAHRRALKRKAAA